MTPEPLEHFRLYGNLFHVPESTPLAETCHAVRATAIRCIVIECPTGKLVGLFLLHYDSAIATSTRLA